MSQKHKALAEAIESFDPKFMIAEPQAENPLPVQASLKEVIDRMAGLLVTGKALYSPGILTADGAFEAHQLIIGEQAIAGEKAGQIIFKATIYLRNASGSPIDSAAIAHGIIAIVANAAGRITEAHREADAKVKKEQAAAEGSAAAAGSSPASPDSSNPNPAATP